MPKIRISEYLLNKHGVRLKNIPAGLTEEEYNEAIVEAMRTCIPQLADNFILTEDDNVDSMIAKLQLLEENPSMNLNELYHTKFKVFMNRYTYDYADCVAKPKKVTMQIKDPSAFLYDDKHAANRIGVYKLSAELNTCSHLYDVSYTYYTVTGQGTYDINTFKVDDAATLRWEPLNRRFEIILPTTTNAKFLQDTEYDVFIEWCGSDFINFEEPAYAYDPYLNYLPSIDTLTKYDRICEQPDVIGWAQKYSDDLFAYYDKVNSTSVVMDNPSKFKILDGVAYAIDDTKHVIISNFDGRYVSASNIGTSTAAKLFMTNARDVVLINCNIEKIIIENCKNVTLINCGFYTNRFTDIYQPHLEINNCETVKFSNCDFTGTVESVNSIYPWLFINDVNTLDIRSSKFEFNFDNLIGDINDGELSNVYSRSVILNNSSFATNLNFANFGIEASSSISASNVLLKQGTNIINLDDLALDLGSFSLKECINNNE